METKLKVQKHLKTRIFQNYKIMRMRIEYLLVTLAMLNSYAA